MLSDHASEAPSDAHLRRLEQIYHAAPTNQLLPARIRIGPGTAAVEMQLRPEYLQAVGTLHGAFLFKVLDEASFYAANSLVDDVFLATASLTVDMVSPVTTEGLLVARARVEHAGRSSFHVDGEVRVGDGLIARSRGTFLRTQQPLPPLGH